MPQYLRIWTISSQSARDTIAADRHPSRETGKQTMTSRRTLRRAGMSDADDIAALFSASRRTLIFLPDMHSVVEDHWFINNECDVTIATQMTCIAGFIAIDRSEIRLLHVRPDSFGQGAGSTLIEMAQSEAAELELWCFQANLGARRFYERHNFHPIQFTDGQDNEEKIPDIRYRWTKS